MSTKAAIWSSVASAVFVGSLLTSGHQEQPARVSSLAMRPMTAMPTPISRDIRIVTDIPYCNSDNPRHFLDVYLPPLQQFPVVVFVHGGGWREGDRVLYSHLGRYMASNGIGLVVPSYRLSPEVTCDAQATDVAKALRWTQVNIASYGGRTDRVFVMGHSAGAHLLSLITTNDTWIRKEQAKQPAGVICISGVYTIDWSIRISGAETAFKGLDKKVYSPMNYVRAGLPPFLVMYAEKDYVVLAGQANDFHKRLQAAGTKSELYVIPSEDHISEIINLVIPGAPHGPRLVKWIKDYSSR